MATICVVAATEIVRDEMVDFTFLRHVDPVLRNGDWGTLRKFPESSHECWQLMLYKRSVASIAPRSVEELSAMLAEAVAEGDFAILVEASILSELQAAASLSDFKLEIYNIHGRVRTARNFVSLA